MSKDYFSSNKFIKIKKELITLFEDLQAENFKLKTDLRIKKKLSNCIIGI